MMIFLEATDPEYLDRIHDCPFVQSKIVPQAVEKDGKTISEHYALKEKKEWFVLGVVPHHQWKGQITSL